MRSSVDALRCAGPASTRSAVWVKIFFLALILSSTEGFFSCAALAVRAERSRGRSREEVVRRRRDEPFGPLAKLGTGSSGPGVKCEAKGDHRHSGLSPDVARLVPSWRFEI